MFPSVRYVVVGSMDELDEGGPMVGLRGGGWWRPTGLRAQSLRWLLGLEMRKPALHSRLIEDAPLPTWSIHYLWVFTNFNWHFYQLWMSVSDLVTLGVSVLPPTRWKYWSNTTVWYYKARILLSGADFLLLRFFGSWFQSGKEISEKLYFKR